MKSIITLLSAIIVFNITTIKAQNSDVISKLVTENGKTYLKVNNIPFPIIGAQIRVDFLMNCDGKTIQQCEPFFSKAQELGVNCVQIPIWWKLIEPTQDNFSWTVLDQILTYINKYNLKMELLWFSTNMCGESFSNFVPNYILNLPGIKLVRNDGRPYWNYYGYQYNLVLNDSTLLSREANAVTMLMGHIREWDNVNGSKHPVISVQVHNEPDAFVRWRFDQKQIHYADNRPFTKQDAWEMTLNALNTVGNAVKKSNYKVVTRCNLITSNGLNSFSELSGASPIDVYNLDGIDIAASDPYVTSVDIIKSNSLSFLELSDQYPLVAENNGAYQNGASLLLTATALGSGYNFYDLATSKFVIDHTSDPANIDEGVYTWDLQEKSHTSKLKTMIKGLVKAYPDVATTKNDNFVAFNIQSDTPQTVFSQIVNSSKIKFSFSTTQGASGFSITKDDYILIYCTDSAQIQLYNATFTNVIKGYFDANANFISEGDISLLSGNTLNAKKETLYKINYTGSSSLTSTAVNNIGTVSADMTNLNVLNFEDEDETSSTIGDLHTNDWQTNTAYIRNTYALNPDKTGVNQTERCATFSGYNSANEWWYGLDIVLSSPIILTPNMTYLHATMMTNNASVDTNRGLILRSSAGGGTDLNQTWQYITDKWADYVYPIPSGAADIMELRFMFNHKTASEITYLDEIVINNDPNPRKLITTGLADVKNDNSQVRIYSSEKSINVISSLPNTYVKVYDILGRCIFSQNILGNKATILIKESGIYLVKCGQSVKKLFVH